MGNVAGLSKKKTLFACTALLATFICSEGALAGREKVTDEQLYGFVGNAAKTALSKDAQSRLHSLAKANTRKDSLARVVFWHEVMLDCLSVDLTADPNTGMTPAEQIGPARASRALAMAQISVFDAINAFRFRYNPYNNIGRAPRGASQGAAIAYAAHDVLAALFPDQTQRLADILAADLLTLSDSAASINLGRGVGEASAAAILARRANDNSHDHEPNFGEGGRIASGALTHYGTPVNGGTGLTYEWTPDPLTPNPSTPSGLNELALGAYWGGVKPFTMTSGDQFRVPPPPEPGSRAYIRAYHQVRLLGGSPDNAGSPSASTPRTRFIGNYWGYDAVPRLGTPPRLFGQIAAQVALDKGIKRPENLARFLAMIHVAQADAGIASWESKFFYNYWRPVTAIRRDDLVAGTATDATWSPVGVSVINTTAAIRATPPFPSYPSGHATFGGAIFEIMREFFGDRTSFTFVSDEYNGEGADPWGTPRPLVPVRFNSFTEAQRQNGISRIYNGVHWRFDNTEGQKLGVKIGRQIVNDFEPFQKRKKKD